MSSVDVKISSNDFEKAKELLKNEKYKYLDFEFEGNNTIITYHYPDAVYISKYLRENKVGVYTNY